MNDIKIKKKVVEDVIYLKNKEILAKIRRGNCILENLNEKTNKSEFVIARKGLIKFFDYQINSKKYSKENEIIWENLNKFFCRKDLYDLDTEQNGIYIYSTEKANGENLQLSYNKNYDAWIIGSKNVTIMLRNLKDLEFFKNYKENENVNINKKEFSPDKRFSYCIEFAELWFEILKDKIEDKNLLNEFKNDLNGFTLIGENIGDENRQHIKLYHQKDIHFYALIQNDSYKICEPLDDCKSFLYKYNLTMVNYTKSKLLKSVDELKEYMRKLYIETLNKNIEEGGEGNVIYYSKIEENNEEVIQLAKLKTFEYRFLRKWMVIFLETG